MDEATRELLAKVAAIERNIERLKTVEERSFRACAVTATSDLSVTQNVPTKVPFNSEIFDYGGFHDNAVNNTRLTVPTDQGGVYLIQLFIVCELAVGAPYRVHTDIRVNDGNSLAGDTRLTIDQTFTVDVCLSVVNTLAAGDYVEARVHHESSAARLVYGVPPYVPVFSVARLDR